MKEGIQMKPMKAAIVGCGDISRAYIETFQNRLKGVELVACANRSEARLRSTAEKYNLRPMAFEDILNSLEIEMIINLTTPDAHYPLTKQALLRGKHVYSEKTLAVTLEQGLELCEIARKQGVRLGCAPDTFLGGGLQTGRHIIDSGLIGKPLTFVASVSRDNGLFGQRLPHLNKAGGGILHDVGCYYLTALVSLLGPVRQLCAFTATNEPERVNMRMTSPDFGRPYAVDVENAVAVSMEFACGVVGVFHLVSDTIIDETVRLEIYGTEGILELGDPNQFGSPVTLRRACAAPLQFPFTHGFTNQSRGIGAAEMAWAIRAGRPHRASMEMACHVLEICSGVLESANSGERYHMRTTCPVPEALPAGFIDCGDWGATEESALV